jgi:UDP-glucose 4-epimerase
VENRVLHRPVVSLRLTNCYGPRLRIRDARQTFLGIWIRRVLEGEAFEVWGGAQLRDLTYADDVTSAFLMAAEQAASQTVAGQVFNIGGSPPVSLLDLAAKLIAANGGQGSFETREFPADRAPIDIGSYAADDRAFRNATGWAPAIDLDKGLKLSLDWYRQRLADYL